ncbi:MAG: tetratricopeptide repeat protein [Luteolibacter sp.]|uniref:tetratricopeptide repeat protein n=1 Tax=Luteolibacter sp. TaxID=1962973 RepID=UPI0032669751
MHPPKIFISATSGDLRSIRQIVKEALLTINCHPVEQTNFEPDARTVENMLRGKIGDCQALIHICGIRYGAEPDIATLPPGTPRRSYTQLEYHIGRQLQEQRGDDHFRVYTFICLEDFPYDEAPDAEQQEKRDLQKAHRSRLFDDPHLREKPKDGDDLKLRVLALQEQVFALQQEQAEVKIEVLRNRHLGLKIATVFLLLLGGIYGGIRLLQRGQEIVIAKQDRQTGMLEFHADLLKEAVVQLEKLTEEKKLLGIRINNLPREDVEKELAVRVGVSAVELRLNIEAGKRSHDALVRARANLLAGKPADAITAAEEVEKADSAAIARLLEALNIKADAFYQTAEYEKSLATHRRISGLADQTADPLAWADAQHGVAIDLRELARYSEAAPLMEQVITIKEQELGPDDPSVAMSVRNLAEILQMQGKLAESAILCRRALEIDETKLGKDDPAVAKDLNQLASVLQAQGKLPEAEPPLRRALEIAGAKLGKDDPDVARGLNNLAGLLKAQGKLVEAEPLFRQALEISEAKLGKEHPDVAVELNNLADLLEARGRAREAEPLLRRSLEIGEAKLGKDHPDIATRLNNLATLLQSQGKPAEAEPLFRRAIAIDELKLGTAHPGLATDYINLASLMHAQGRLTEAEPLFRRGLEINETALGKDHPSVAKSLNNLANLLRVQGKPAEAEPLFRRAIEIGEAKLDKDHPDLAIWFLNLAVFLRDQGRPAEAEPFYRRVIQIALHHRKRYGEAVPNEDKMLEKYAELLQKLGRSEPEVTGEILHLRQEAGLE